MDCDLLLRGERNDACRVIDSDLKEHGRSSQWKLVHYQASWWRRHLNRSGTCTITASDPPGLVLSRLHFLLTQKQDLPSHHFLKQTRNVSLYGSRRVHGLPYKQVPFFMSLLLDR